MAKYRNNLPQTAGGIFLTDGGLETTLIFREGLELPHFMAFPLLETVDGRKRLRDYFLPYVELARRLAVGFVLESATWRANADWGAKIGLSEADLEKINRRAIDFLREIRDDFETEKTRIVLSGCVGPRGDGYRAGQRMSAAQALDYHRTQIRVLRQADADLISAFTLNYAEEAIGIARAARAEGIPAVISFTVETDGRLPSGQTLGEAIEATDQATGAYPAYFMVNCAHPTHFAGAFHTGAAWTKRIRGIRANASTKSHAELDASAELDAGNPAQLGAEYRELTRKFQRINVLGGCCGTDFRHVEAIAAACVGQSVTREFETV